MVELDDALEHFNQGKLLFFFDEALALSLIEGTRKHCHENESDACA